MAGIKTGNKGFVNPADGNKVYVMDPVLPGDPGANGTPPDYDPGDMNVDKNVKDISTATRITLGSYLSKLTRGEVGSSTVANKYSVDPSTPTSPVLQLSTNGYPTPPAISDNSEQFQQVLPSSYSQEFVSVQQDIKKGRAPGDGLDGNDLLREATPTQSSTQLSSDSPLKTYTAEVSSANRWASDSSTFTGGEDPLSPSAAFNVPLQSSNTAGLPSETVSSLSEYDLNLPAAIEKASDITSDNEFPVVTSPDSLLASTTTYDGFPAPLTPPPNQNSGPDGSFVHAPNLPATPSPAGMKKGKAPGSEPDGHRLLGSEFQETTSGVVPPQAVVGRVTAETDRNEFDSSSPLFPPEFDVTEPPANYEARIADTNEKGKYESADKVPVTLERLRLKSAEETQDNSYPVDEKLKELQSLVDPATKLPETLVDTSNELFFRKREEIKPLSSDANIQNLSKGKGDKPYDGNNLLPNISGNRSISSQKTYEGKGDLQYVVTGTPQTDKTSQEHPIRSKMEARGGTLSIGNNRFAPAFVPAGFNPEYTLKDGTKVKAMKFAQVGYALSQRASSEIPGILATDGAEYNPTGNLAEAGAILPSAAQLGILKVDNHLLSAEDVLTSLNEEDYPVDSLSQIAYFDNQSWGNLTNVSEPYDSDLNIGLLVTTIGMMLAISILLIFSLIPGGGFTTRPRDDVTGQLFKGKFAVGNPKKIFPFPNIYELFDLHPTENESGSCLRTGFNSYFLGEDSDDPFDILKAALLLAAQSPFSNDRQFYMPLVTCRTIVRSGLLLATAISRAVNSPNVMSQVKGIVNVIRTIKESKLVRSINVFMRLGDAVIKIRAATVKIDAKTGEKELASVVDQIPTDNLIHTSVVKSRLGNDVKYDPTLSWSSARAPTLYLVSKQAKLLSDADRSNELGSFKGLGALKNSIKNGYFQQRSSTDKPEGNDKGRIDADTRRRMEDYLEAEYVPFYFHDVRTNEIVSFHAFLASLSDDYTASYDSVDGIGRIEPVKIYKSTARKIGMSFFVAATNEEDFGHMWYKINKLTTLVYPQYDKGKMLLGKDYQFKAPFSQRIAASPLVRIRLGELLRSNYSRFAMARLFGLTDGDATIRYAETGKQDAKQVALFADPSASEADERKRSTPEVGDFVMITGAGGSLFTPGDADITLISGDPTKRIKQRLTDESLKVVKGIDSKNKITVKFTSARSPMITKLLDMINSGIISNVIPDDSNSAFEISASQVVVVKKAKENEPAAGAEAVSDQTSLAAIKSFVDPKNNSIVKSFESAGGKGLAGFIESMNFDWYSASSWEVSPGFAAPKICKVTISFSPIHDITPGLDHKGYNRAPIYPVGNAMRPAAVAEPEEA